MEALLRCSVVFGRQVAKKHASAMPVQGSLRAVAAASRLVLGPLQAEVADLRRSLNALRHTLDSMHVSNDDSFREVSTTLYHVHVQNFSYFLPVVSHVFHYRDLSGTVLYFSKTLMAFQAFMSRRALIAQDLFPRVEDTAKHATLHSF